MMYKVRQLLGVTYQVILLSSISASDGIHTSIPEYFNYETVVFQGPLADCKAYIELKEKGYLDE